MRKNQTSFNEKCKSHGYWKVYYTNGNLSFKGEYVDGLRHGPWEEYHYNEMLFLKGEYVYGRRKGYWLAYYDDGLLCNRKFYAR